MNRPSISKRLRFEVFKRDNFTCQYCGAHPPQVVLELDHIEAVANGGSSHSDNLVTACEPCNRGKGAIPLSCVPQSLADKAIEIQEREEQLRGYSEIMEAKILRIEQECWRIVETLEPGRKEFPRKDFRSIKTFIERIGFYEVLEAGEIASSRKPWSANTRWRYFCGICWRKIRAQECPVEPIEDVDPEGDLIEKAYADNSRDPQENRRFPGGKGNA